ncbi:MAG: hypothetical protein GC179_27240 [Anaerolineaceae bacterium]|nr:hypothetical protein [Anaerolineaceae bacterium]
MFKKILVGTLVLTLAAAVVIGLTDSRPTSSVSAQEISATAPVNNGSEQNTAGGTGQQQSLQNVGDPWTGIGIITAFDTTGITLSLVNNTSVYVELGPSSYWQSQGVTLAVGDHVTVQGFFNGDQYHAAQVTTIEGTTLHIRSESGQPLWSGGSSEQNGQGGTGQGQEQIPADQWETITGTITAVYSNNLTIKTNDNTTITIQLGRQDFIQGQSVVFTTGDKVEVLGFWQNEQFQAGQITNTSTNQRLLLRDPNGRPLWGGPGRNGSGGQGNGNGNSNGGQGNGNGKGGNGNGNKGNGQANQSTTTP